MSTLDEWKLSRAGKPCRSPGRAAGNPRAPQPGWRRYGILMVLHDVDREGAFSILKEQSQVRNVKLRLIAREVVELEEHGRPP